MTPFVLWIPGNPVPKGRPRLGQRGTYTDPKTRQAEDDLKWRLKAAHVPKFEGPLKLELHFHRSDKRRADLDNLMKLALDAMNGLVYADDSQVWELHAVLERGCEEPGTWLKVSPMEQRKEVA